MYKEIIIYLINIFLIPLYICFICLSFILSFLPIHPTKVAFINFQLKLKVNKIKARYLIIKLFFHYLIYFVEGLFFYKIRVINNQQEIINSFNNYLIKNQNKGIVILSGHLGNMEILANFIVKNLNKHKKIMYSLAKKSNISFFTLIMEKYRHLFELELLWTDRQNLLKVISLELKKNNVIALLNDQKPEVGGIFIKFFNEYASFPYAGISIALKQPVNFIFCSITRKIIGKFNIKFEFLSEDDIYLFNNTNLNEQKIILENLGVLTNNIKINYYLSAFILAHYVKFLEKQIRLKPEEWCWDYKKWSRKF